MHISIPGTRLSEETLQKQISSVRIVDADMVLDLADGSTIGIQSFWEYFSPTGVLLEAAFAGLNVEASPVKELVGKTVELIETISLKTIIRLQDKSWIEVENNEDKSKIDDSFLNSHRRFKMEE